MRPGTRPTSWPRASRSRAHNSGPTSPYARLSNPTENRPVALSISCDFDQTAAIENVARLLLDRFSNAMRERGRKGPQARRYHVS